MLTTLAAALTALLLLVEATSTPCYRAAAAPGAKVLQVFHHVRIEHLNLLRVYSPLVAGQFAVTHDAAVFAGFHTARCLNATVMYYLPCLAELLQRLESAQGLQGDEEGPCSENVTVAGA
jgi:hypothetical protein